MAELYLPSAGDWISALEAGQKAGMTDRRMKAATTAAGLMTGGNYQGAAGALYGAGDFQGGSAIADAGYKQTEQSLKLSRQKAVQEKLAAGDFSGAYAAAGTDPELLGGLDKVAAHAKETTSTMAAALQALKGPDGNWLPPEVAAQKYAAMKPTLVARGLDQKQLDAFQPTPDNLNAIQSQVLGLDKQIEMHKPVVVGQSLIDPATGKPVYQGTEWKEVPEGGKLVPVTGEHTGLGGPAAAQAAPGAGQSTQSAPIPSGGIYATVGQIASQNGAKPEEVAYLQRLAQVESHGDPNAQNGRSTGLFQFHPDTFAAAGGQGDIHDVGQQTQAALNLSRHDRQKLQGLGVQPDDANVYIMHQQGPGGGPALLTAPPDVGAVAALTPIYGNSKKGQARAQAAIVGNGGSPDMTAGQFVDMWRQRWAKGGAPVDSAQAAAPPNAGVTMAGDPAGTVYGNPKGAEWVQDGRGNLVNKKTGDRKIDPTAGADIQANPDLVKAILEGRAPVPTTNRAATDPKWQAAMAAAMAQDPTLDAANYGTRVKTRADFATGTAAKTKTALNTALGHAGDLDGQVDALHNGSVTMLNSIKNYAATQTGDPRVKTFDLTKEALMHEAMKVFSGSAGSLMEFQQLADTLKAEDSPAQQHAVIRKLVGLLASKMDALGEQYKTGMGKELDQSQIMSPHAQEVFSRISGLPNGTAPAQAKPAAPASGRPPLSSFHR